MSKFALISIAVLISAGCQPDVSPLSRRAEPQTHTIEHSPDAPTHSSADVRDEGTLDGEPTRITAADALRIGKERSGHAEKPKPEATARLLSFRECYQRAWDNAHGDPDLQGPVAFGTLEKLDRDGRCWSVEATYGHRLEITYIDEFGNVIYQFHR